MRKRAILMAGLMMAVVFCAFSVNAAEHKTSEIDDTKDDGQPLDITGVYVRVYDANTHEPISGALVIERCVWYWNGIPILRIRMGLTDTTGVWTDDSAPRYAIYHITASKVGYHTQSISRYFCGLALIQTFHLVPI